MAGARFPEQFNTRESLMKLTEKVHLFWESSCESLWNRYNKKGPCIRCLNLSRVLARPKPQGGPPCGFPLRPVVFRFRPVVFTGLRLK